MLPCGQRAIETVERLRKSTNEFTNTLLEITGPIDMTNLPNPFDVERELERKNDEEK